MMNRIEFAIDYSPTGEYPDEVLIRIDGRDLVERVREVELPFALREGAPSIAGGYMGLPAKDVCPPSRHFLGASPYPLYPDQFRTQLFQCSGCGLAGCWDLFCRIEVGIFIVTWSDFSQPHRDGAGKYAWSYEKLGPFEFDRLQYEEALGKLIRETVW